VRVSDDFFWAKGARGRISAPPDAVTSLSGAWDGGLTRQKVSGTDTVYWVWFDEPQFGADGDGPYSGVKSGKALSVSDREPELATNLLGAAVNE